MDDLINIDKHAYKLTEFVCRDVDIDYLNGPEHWYQMCGLLHLASGIKSVEFDRIRFDEASGYCSNADYADEKQHELENRLVKELTQFSFIWQALEAFVDHIVPIPKKPKPPGKVNQLCLFLKNKLGHGHGFPEYYRELDHLKTLLKADCRYSSLLKIDSFSLKPYISIEGLGIAMTYKLRNLQSHGALFVPCSRQEDERYYDELVVRSCTRIVLFTIQYLLLVEFKNALTYDAFECEYSRGEKALRILHLIESRVEFNENQYDMFGA